MSETPYRIEPCILDPVPAEITDLVAELVSAATTLDTRLHPQTAASLADLVRIMNCYYSNLIEGHNTRPKDIERALAKQYDDDDQRRDLQMEAAAHIRVQELIDQRFFNGEELEPASSEFIRWLHHEFYKDAPHKMLTVGSDAKSFQMIPGEFRSRIEHEVSVGRHKPPSSERVVGFMEYFASKYDFSRLRQGSQITAMAAAHHRLNYIHPFADGNGRVSRLMSHAMALRAGIGTHGLWSISRGLARGLEHGSEYRQMMDATDEPRQDDVDGRGNLSRRRLEEFVSWFLRICLDQVTFMASLFDLSTLNTRLQRVVLSNPDIHPSAAVVLEEILHRGEMPRGRAPNVTGLKERSARSVIAQLLKCGLVTSATPKSPLRLRFNTSYSAALFPQLFLQE